MNRTARPAHDPSACLHRLRRQLFGTGATIVLALGGCACLGRLLTGATPAELFAPAAGTLLALAAQWLCVDAALRHVRRGLDVGGATPQPVPVVTLRA